MYVTGEWVVDHVGRQKSFCQAQDSCSPVKPVFYPDCIRLDGQVPRIRYFFKQPHFIRKVFHPVPISSAIPWAIREEVHLCPSVRGMHKQVGFLMCFPVVVRPPVSSCNVYQPYWSVTRAEDVCIAVLLGEVGHSDLKEGSGEEPAA